MRFTLTTLTFDKVRRSSRRGFTLIEVLVVVAIIALLISILLPSLRAAKDQANRAVCASNLHQQGLAMNSYAHDYKGYLPFRGWRSYSLSETPHEAYNKGGTSSKTLVNLALLMGKHLATARPTRESKLGKEWDIVYCPTTKGLYQNHPTGLKTLWVPPPPSELNWTIGGYNYALPMAQRCLTATPKLEGDVYPRDVKKLDDNWVKALRAHAKTSDPLSAMPRGMQPLVTDWVVGGVDPPHREYLNTLYSDGHARFVPYPPMVRGLTSGDINSFELWYFVMTHP